LKNRGFTLLEVMVAVAILGLSLTVILSAQAGLYSGGAYAQHTSVAIGLGRCRMTELEEELLKLGYPESDTKDDGTCCEGDTHQEMRCTWKVERIELPQAKPPDLGTASSAGSLSLGASGPGASPSPAGGGPLAMMSQLATNPAAIAGDAGMAGMASAIQQGMGGPGGIESMAMSFVYPMLKPMLETSIRKVTVSVNWKEGIQDRDITIVQYVTRPMKAPPPLAGASDAGSPLLQGLPSLLGGGLTGGATTTTGGAIR
jgi:general secretion pathway protein I